MDLLIWIGAALSLLLGCFIQTALGFGMAVLAAPIIVLLEPAWVPVTLTFTALILSLLNSWNLRHAVELSELKLAFVTRIPGTVFGAWLLLHLDNHWLQLFVALCVLLAVLVSWRGKQFSYTPARMGWAAFISGIMGTTTSIGGPPMALVMQHGAPKTIRANLSVYFLYSCTLSLISYALTDQIDSQLWLVSFSFIPVCLLGFLLGIKARDYVDAGRFRPLLLILCSIAGLFALFGSLLSFLR